MQNPPQFVQREPLEVLKDILTDHVNRYYHCEVPGRGYDDFDLELVDYPHHAGYPVPKILHIIFPLACQIPIQKGNYKAKERFLFEVWRAVQTSAKFFGERINEIKIGYRSKGNFITYPKWTASTAIEETEHNIFKYQYLSQEDRWRRRRL